MSDFEIKIIFPTDGRMFDGVPVIEVRSSYISKNSYDAMCDYYDKN